MHREFSHIQEKGYIGMNLEVCAGHFIFSDRTNLCSGKSVTCIVGECRVLKTLPPQNMNGINYVYIVQ